LEILLFDTETNGYLEQSTELHCLVIKDASTGETVRYNDQPGGIPLEVGLRRLETADCIIAHNAIDFDVPVLRKLYPWLKINNARVFDTLVVSRTIFPDLYDADLRLVQRGTLEKSLIKSHSLKAWGQRLGEHKADYEGGFESWNPEMEDYCEQDVHTLDALYVHLCNQQYPPEPLQLEHQVRWIVTRQEKFGFNFNEKKAVDLYVLLSKRKLELEAACKETFKPFYLRDGTKAFTPKSNSKKYGYAEGAPLSKVKLVEFNPGSRDHIANRLKRLFGWEPSEFTDGGSPKIDEVVLAGLVYPQAKVLQEYFLVDKRISQLAEGDSAWLKKSKDGKIHGRVNTMGAVTSRMTHMDPNLAQVPSCSAPYGAECRELFEPPPGYVQVGADASGLELRGLAGYMAKWDNGAYIKTVCEGRNEDGTDIHTVNMKALGITRRDIAKTFIYAFLYGAGDEKIGATLFNSKGPKARKAGKAAKEKFLEALPALSNLIAAVKKAAKRGWIKGLDGRRIPVRSDHAALNTLLQSAGAIIMKRALVILDDSLQARFKVGIDYEFMANIHDEWQIAVKPEFAEEVGKLAVEAIRLAGLYYNFKCPLTGEFKIGHNWKATH
jgi:DNA polymerase-1